MNRQQLRKRSGKMKPEISDPVGRLTKKMILVLSLGLVFAGGTIGPAAADDWHRHEWREHRMQNRWERRHYYVPPPVYYVPPPRAVYVAPPVMVLPPVTPGLSIVVPLRIR
jgi:hypothetical protein